MPGVKRVRERNPRKPPPITPRPKGADELRQPTITHSRPSCATGFHRELTQYNLRKPPTMTLLPGVCG